MIVIYWELGEWTCNAISYNGTTDFFSRYGCNECVWLVPGTEIEE